VMMTHAHCGCITLMRSSTLRPLPVPRYRSRRASWNDRWRRSASAVVRSLAVKHSYPSEVRTELKRRRVDPSSSTIKTRNSCLPLDMLNTFPTTVADLKPVTKSCADGVCAKSPRGLDHVEIRVIRGQVPPPPGEIILQEQLSSGGVASQAVDPFAAAVA